MAKLPPVKRLLLGDFVSESAWIGPLCQNLNNFMDGVYNALNQAVTIQDNTTGAIIPVVLTALPTSAAPVKVPWSKSGTPIAVLIGNVQQRTVALANSVTPSGTLLTVAPALEWQYITNTNIGNYIYLTNVVGIPTPTTAITINLQLIVFTG